MDLVIIIGNLASALAFVGLLAFQNIVEYGRIHSVIFPLALFLWGVWFSMAISAPNKEIFWVTELGAYYVTYSWAYNIIWLTFLGYTLIPFVGSFNRLVHAQFPPDLHKKFRLFLLGAVISISSYVVFHALGFLLNNFVIALFNIFPWVVGVLVVLSALRYRGLDVLYLKQKIFWLVIYTRSGEVLLTYRFRELETKIESLVVGGITGIQILIDVSLELDEYIEHVEFKDQHILIESLQKIAVGIIVDNPSVVFRQALKNFCTYLRSSPQFKDLEKFHEKDARQETIEHILSAFSFFSGMKSALPAEQGGRR